MTTHVKIQCSVDCLSAQNKEQHWHHSWDLQKSFIDENMWEPNGWIWLKWLIVHCFLKIDVRPCHGSRDSVHIHFCKLLGSYFFFQQLHPPWDVLQTSGDHWSKPRITTATLSQPWPKTTSKPNNKIKCQIFWCCFATLPERSIVCLSMFQIIYFDLTSAISETTQNQGNKSTPRIGTLDLQLEP